MLQAIGYANLIVLPAMLIMLGMQLQEGAHREALKSAGIAALSAICGWVLICT